MYKKSHTVFVCFYRMSCVTRKTNNVSFNLGSVCKDCIVVKRILNDELFKG